MIRPRVYRDEREREDDFRTGGATTSLCACEYFGDIFSRSPRADTKCRAYARSRVEYTSHLKLMVISGARAAYTFSYLCWRDKMFYNVSLDKYLSFGLFACGFLHRKLRFYR